MKDMDFSILQDYGIDYGKGLDRCVGDEKIYARLLAAFLKDRAMPRAREAYAHRDYSEVFAHMHELKGACGNAAMEALYGAVSRLVETLRDGKFAESDVAAQFAEVDALYDKARAGVEKLLG